MPPIISIVGASNSGKTTFLENLIPELASRGYRVGAVKHDAHGFEMDREGKDTWRLQRAGAEVIAISSLKRFASIRRTDGEISLEEIAERFFWTEDIILTEGFKRERFPKIEVFRSAIGQKPICGPGDNLIALVSDNTVDVGVPLFSTSDSRGVADFIENRYLSDRKKRRLIAGAVLAGGRSLRFGKNKALQTFKGKRFIDLAIESLRPFCEPVMAVVNEIEPYVDTGAMLVRDIIAHQGPLGGIYTALLFSPCEWVFIKATDMPFLVPEMASLIIEGAKGQFDAVVPKVDEFFDPLLAAYNRRCLPVIARQLQASENRQVVAFYRKIRLNTIVETQWRKVDPEALSFKNVNTMSDLAEIDGAERS